MIITTLSDNGTITLPDRIIQALNLQEGDTVAFIPCDEGFTLMKHDDQAQADNPSLANAPRVRIAHDLFGSVPDTVSFEDARKERLDKI